MVAEISRRKYRYKNVLLLIFFKITNFLSMLLKFQEEKIGEKCIVADFFLSSKLLLLEQTFSSTVAEILRRKYR